MRLRNMIQRRASMRLLLERCQHTSSQRTSRAATLLCVAALAGCAPTVQQTIVRGTPKHSQEPVANEPSFSLETSVDGNGVLIQLRPGRCITVTETPLQINTVTTQYSPSVPSWVTWTLGAAALGYGGYSYATLSSHPTSCPAGDDKCVDRKQAERATLASLGVGALLAGLGTYWQLSGEHSATKTEQNVERTQGALQTCAKPPSGVPVQLRVANLTIEGITDAQGRAKLTLSPTQARSLGQATEGMLWVNGRSIDSVSLVAVRDAQGLESFSHPGPVTLGGALIPGGIKLERGTPLLAEWQGDWYEARLIGYEGDRPRVHYWGWEGTWDMLLEPAQVRVLAKGEKFAPLASRSSVAAGIATDLVGLRGTLYSLSPNGAAPTDFKDAKPLGLVSGSALYLNSASMNLRSTNSPNEWFGAEYHAAFRIAQAGTYRFRLSSDDGSRLYIDGKKVIDNWGFHTLRAQEAAVNLTASVHDLKVEYVQGPSVFGLSLELAEPSGPYRIFDATRYAPVRVAYDDDRARVAVRTSELLDATSGDFTADGQRVLLLLERALVVGNRTAKLRIELVGGVGQSSDLIRRIRTWLLDHGVAADRILLTDAEQPTSSARWLTLRVCETDASCMAPPGQPAQAFAAPPAEQTVSAPEADTCSVAKIDWRNRSYPKSKFTKVPITLVNGRHWISKRKVDPATSFWHVSEVGTYYSVGSAQAAQLDATGSKFALLNVSRGWVIEGISGNSVPPAEPSTYYVVLIKDGCELEDVGSVYLGANDVARVEDNALLVFTPKGKTATRQEWRFRDGSLQQVDTRKVSVEELVAPERRPPPCDPGKSLTALGSYVGKRGFELLEADRCVNERLAARVQKAKATFERHSSMGWSPIERRGNYLVSSACQIHSCGGSQAVFTVDLSTGEVEAAIISQKNVTWLSAGQPSSALKQVAKEIADGNEDF